jgi:hypothetical protein
VICGHYRQFPAVVGDLTPAELVVMLDGIDWVNDREWVRALFLRTQNENAKDLLTLNFPHFRTPHVTEIIRIEPEKPKSEGTF